MIITVSDVNDNHPVFTATQYNGTIEEGSLPSEPVTFVSCGMKQVTIYYNISLAGSTNRGQ